MELDYEEVKLFISCRNLVSKDQTLQPELFAKVKLLQREDTTKLGKTEIQKNNPNPNFVKSFTFTYIFEIKQILLIEVLFFAFILFILFPSQIYDNDDSVNKINVPVGVVAGSKNFVITCLNCQLYLTDPSGQQVGKIILKLAQTQEPTSLISWQWQGVQLKDEVDFQLEEEISVMFLKIYRKDQESWLSVHETEEIVDNFNPIWQPFSIDLAKICNNNYEAPIKIECYDSQQGEHQLLGEAILTLDKVLKEEQTEFVLENPKLKKPGSLKIVQSSIINNYSFLDYLQGGIQLNMLVAIDFTASNGPLSDVNSLHFQGGTNEYQIVLQEICDILLQYDQEKQIPLYGFGAKPNGESSVNHCFPLTGDENNCKVSGLQGINDYYQKAAASCCFHGPTFISQTLTQAMKFSQEQQQLGVYTVLLILTDGEVLQIINNFYIKMNDMEKGIQLIIQSAKLPLSVIIIGIGYASFSQMKIFNGNKKLSGAGADQRKLVSFVKFVILNGCLINFEFRFENYIKDLPKFTQKAIAELPNQLVDFMRREGIKPQPQQLIEMQQLEI